MDDERFSWMRLSSRAGGRQPPPPQKDNAGFTEYQSIPSSSRTWKPSGTIRWNRSARAAASSSPLTTVIQVCRCRSPTVVRSGQPR